MKGRADGFRRVEVTRRVEDSVAGELAAGERRRAVTLLRGVGPGPGTGDADWVLAVTDRRVLLLTLGTRRQPAQLVVNAPVGEVRVLDARLRGATAAVVLRFPDAVIGWFVPVTAWRPETEAVVDALGSALASPWAPDPYPDRDRDRGRDRTSPVEPT